MHTNHTDLARRINKLPANTSPCTPSRQVPARCSGQEATRPLFAADSASMGGVTQMLALVAAALSYALIRASTLTHARIHEAQLDATARNSCEPNRRSALYPPLRRPTRVIRSGRENESSADSRRRSGRENESSADNRGARSRCDEGSDEGSEEPCGREETPPRSTSLSGAALDATGLPDSASSFGSAARSLRKSATGGIQVGRSGTSSGSGGILVRNPQASSASESGRFAWAHARANKGTVVVTRQAAGAVEVEAGGCFGDDGDCPTRGVYQAPAVHPRVSALAGGWEGSSTVPPSPVTSEDAVRSLQAAFGMFDVAPRRRDPSARPPDVTPRGHVAQSMVEAFGRRDAPETAVVGVCVDGVALGDGRGGLSPVSSG